MSRDKAPDNMPTENIRRYLESTRAGIQEWGAILADRERGVTTARNAIARCTEQEVEYEEWLEKRLEEERG